MNGREATRLALWRIAFALALIAGFVVALLPASPGPDLFDQADKLRHALAFLALWWLGARARAGSAPKLALELLLFGVGVEFAQAFTPTREASAGDVLADVLGIALGWALTTWPLGSQASQRKTVGVSAGSSIGDRRH